MKLFILNKEEFDQDASFEQAQKEIHKKAFNELFRYNVCFDEPPENIKVIYDDFEWEFNFVKQKNDFFIYKYVL
jgi:hypothetical protein